jgi:hypothetical protein
MTANGHTADYNGISSAIAAAEALSAGATVLIPGGTCMIDKGLFLANGAGIVVEGTTTSSGVPLTTITDPGFPQSGGGAFTIRNDGNTLQDMVLDQSSYGGAIGDDANYTTLQRMTIMGGPASYVLFFFATPSGAPGVGNRILNSTVVSLVNHIVSGPGTAACDDGLSWSSQNNSVIQNLTFIGTRLALFHDNNVTVNGYTYYPGPQTCDLDGYYITQPSSGITMSNLTMYGSGGIIGFGNSTAGYVSNTTITNEHVLPPTAGYGFSLNGASHGLYIRNVDSLNISNSSFNSGQQSNSSILFQPTFSAKGVVVQSSQLVHVAFWGSSATSTTAAAKTQAQFNGDTYPAYPWTGSNYTFSNGSGAPVNLSISQGTFNNSQPNEPPYYGLLHGSGISFTVSSLAGYTGPTSGTT